MGYGRGQYYTIYLLLFFSDGHNGCAATLVLSGALANVHTLCLTLWLDFHWPPTCPRDRDKRQLFWQRPEDSLFLLVVHSGGHSGCADHHFVFEEAWKGDALPLITPEDLYTPGIDCQIWFEDRPSRVTTLLRLALSHPT